MNKRAKKISQSSSTIDFREVAQSMTRLKGERRKPTSIALEENVIQDLKLIALREGIPYQVLMRVLILEGLRKLIN